MLSTLQICGWQILPSLVIKDDTRAVYPLILRKKQFLLTLFRNSKYALIKIFSLTGTDLSADLGFATWADLDQRGRLVYARGGCLHAFTQGRETELANLNLDQPPRRPNPEEKVTE